MQLVPANMPLVQAIQIDVGNDAMLSLVLKAKDDLSESKGETIRAKEETIKAMEETIRVQRDMLEILKSRT